MDVVTPNGSNDEEGLNYFLTPHFNSFLDRYLISISSSLATVKFVLKDFKKD